MGDSTQVLGIVLPVILMLAAGMFLRRRGVLTEDGIGTIKELLMKIFIPAIVFKTFYSTFFTWKSLILVAAMFVVTIVTYQIGRVVGKRIGLSSDLFPYLCTSIEGGQMGFALFILLFGQDELYHLALLDLGNALILFTVILTRLRLRAESDRQYSRKEIARSLITPINVAILTGIIISATGLGRVITNSSFGTVLNSILSFVGGPVSVLILLVVGYGLSFRKIRWSETIRTIAARLAIMAVFGVGVFVLAWALFPFDILYRYAVVMAFVLPPSYIYAMFAKDESEEAYLGAVLALYTVITLIGFVIVAVLSA